jgi:hypothetical protein
VSRKNLSRTVIEGGRYYHNSWMRRASHGVERASTREWLDRVAVDLDEADATVAPARRHVHKMFHDKLAPAHRWLVAQVGRPWSKVYSELCAKFDTRTVAGRHVVHDHMLQWVHRADAPVGPYFRHSQYYFFVDAHGILRRPRWSGRSFEKLRRQLTAWAEQRVCALTYRGWWWFRYDPVGAACTVAWQCGRYKHHEVAGGRYHAVELVGDRPMTRAEVKRLHRMPEEFRPYLIIKSPWPSR